MTARALTVHDGSGNAYLLREEPGGRARFEYDPVRPEQSSTGFYSGGAPRAAAIDGAAFGAAWEAAERLGAAVELHVPRREKGTGLFELTTPAGARAFIVRRGPELDGFLSLLSGLGRG